MVQTIKFVKHFFKTLNSVCLHIFGVRTSGASKLIYAYGEQNFRHLQAPEKFPFTSLISIAAEGAATLKKFPYTALKKVLVVAIATRNLNQL